MDITSVHDDQDGVQPKELLAGSTNAHPWQGWSRLQSARKERYTQCKVLDLEISTLTFRPWQVSQFAHRRISSSHSAQEKPAIEINDLYILLHNSGLCIFPAGREGLSEEKHVQELL